MLEHNRDGAVMLRLCRHRAERNTEERGNRQIYRHAHAAHGSAHYHSLLMQFDETHALIRFGIGGREADRKGEGVEPHAMAARPGGLVPADLRLTPQDCTPRQAVPPGRDGETDRDGSEST